MPTKPKLIIPYPGSKGLFSKILLPELPQAVNNYHELFAGRGNVFFNYVLSGGIASSYHLNDLYSGDWLHQLKSYTKDFDFVPVAPNFEIFKEWLNSPESPERTIIQPCICFMGGSYKIGGSRYDKHKGFQARWVQKFTDGRKILSEKNAIITQKDWLDYLKGQVFEKNDFLYCDPPYDKGFAYKYNEAQAYPNIDHNLFLDHMNSISNQCKIVISGFNSETYQNKMKSWNMVSKNRWASGKNKDQKKSQYVDEYIWKNF